MTREDHHAIDLKLFRRFGPEGVREGFAQLGHEGVDVLIASEGDGATERERLWSPSRVDGDALRLCWGVAKEQNLVFELRFDAAGEVAWEPGSIRGGWHACFKQRAAVKPAEYPLPSHAWCESPALACSFALIDLPTRGASPHAGKG
jgi:hypothetical protein